MPSRSSLLAHCRISRPTAAVRGVRVLGGLLSVVAVCCLASTPVAQATDYTWSGGGPSAVWSEGANWLGGSAPPPDASIDTLTLPKLGSFSTSSNDLSGLSVNSLVIDDSNGYKLTGDGLTLGGGGLSISSTETSLLYPFVASLPLILAGSQTWNISAPETSGHAIELAGALSGENANLTINVNSLMTLDFYDSLGAVGGSDPDDELGDVTINGTEVATPGGGGEVVYRSPVNLPTSFNATDGKRLTAKNVELAGDGATGPLTTVKSVVRLSGPSIGSLASEGSILELNGGVKGLTLDGQSTLRDTIDAEGSVPGINYNQITSTGAVSVGGELQLEDMETEARICPPPLVGQVYTLISTTVSLTGQFANASNGGTLTAGCIATAGGAPIVERVYSYRINYNATGSPETVTATALPAVPVSYAEEPPTISGGTTEGETLTVRHAFWSNDPTSYGDQWQRCDSSGGSCQAIAGATGQSYTLAASDVGATIRAQETASNSEGTSEPAESEATAVVQAASAGGGPSGGSSPPPSTTSTSTSVSPSTVSQPSVTPHVVKPLTTAQKLAKALKQCKHDKPLRKRKVCESQAKKRYRVKKQQTRK
jgi:hypothetical protein